MAKSLPLLCSWIIRSRKRPRSRTVPAGNPLGRGRVIVVSAIDNLVKGAAGQAIQNMNLMFGWPETTGLEQIALFP